MFSPEEYQLLDFGEGRRLERFGELILDRPCPSASTLRRNDRDLWRRADAVFCETPRRNSDAARVALGTRGVWRAQTPLGARFFIDASENENANGAESGECRPWKIRYSEKFVLELKGSPFGHVGAFPEQAENWDRIAELCRAAEREQNEPTRLLNLFGYTGGSALASVSAGAETTHLDAARNVVDRAKRNATLSFSESTCGAIRWIVDDASKYVKRSVKRGARFNGIVLDPPSYGHGARGETWRLSRDLPRLLSDCVELLDERFAFVVLTCHTPKFEASKLAQLLKDALRARFYFDDYSTEFLAKKLELRSLSGRALPSGDLALATLRRKRF